MKNERKGGNENTVYYLSYSYEASRTTIFGHADLKCGQVCTGTYMYMSRVLNYTVIKV